MDRANLLVALLSALIGVIALGFALSGGRVVTVPLVRDCAALLGDQQS